MAAALAVSLGDPAGVGPELAAAAWAAARERAAAPGINSLLDPFFVVGGASLIAAAAASRGLDVPIVRICHADQAAQAFAQGLPVLGDLDHPWTPGAPDEEGARVALASLAIATDLACGGEAAGLVTGPIAKALLAEVGFAHPGQTEFVAEACGVAAEDAVMMLAGPSLRTVPLTVHVPLADVPQLLTDVLIVRRARIVAAALRSDFGISDPRLAMAALNPHAGEHGRMGDEEARVIAPAIAALAAEGLAVSGPHPADALFAPRARADYDVALCMYHDQALIPLKTLDFDAGVNVTLGLPLIRTSPDHGTAFAIAGRNLAEPGATIAAIRLAGECVRHRAAAQG